MQAKSIEQSLSNKKHLGQIKPAYITCQCFLDKCYLISCKDYGSKVVLYITAKFFIKHKPKNEKFNCILPKFSHQPNRTLVQSPKSYK